MKNYMMQKITGFWGLIFTIGTIGMTEAQGTFTWNPAGPIYTAGRARNMVVDKNDPSGNTLYVGSTSSGVFKTTNGGSNWAPVDDQGEVRNISYLAQSADGTIWVATGEGFLRFGQQAKAQKGTGLYKLVNNSLQQVVSSSVVGEVITRVACDPGNAARIALATNSGIWASLNGGASFFKCTLSGVSNASLVSGMDVKFDNAGNLYCSAGSELAYSVYNNVDSKVYKSADASLTTLNSINPTSNSLSDSKYGRIELAIAPSNNNVIYASCAAKSTANPTTGILGSQASATLRALFVSYDAGNSWGLVTQGSSQIDPLSNGGSIASGDYAHVILVDPSNPDQLFYGGYSFYIYTRTGGSNLNPIGTWVRLGFNTVLNTPFYLHENIHDIKIVGNSSSNAKFYFITDAGIYRSSDLSTSNFLLPPSFQPFYKGLVTGQFNSVGIMRFPIGVNTGSLTAAGQSVTPFSGFAGGTGGNGLNYYSGTYSLVTQENSYLGGEVYNVEMSKILDGAAIMSIGTGGGAMYRSTNVKNSAPTPINLNKYTGGLSRVAPTNENFLNTGFSTGTPFKLWENYGQLTNSPDFAIFYNDSSNRIPASLIGLSTLTTTSNFTFSIGRPFNDALIDSIVIRTATVTTTNPDKPNCPTSFSGSDLQDIFIKLNNNYPITGTLTTPQVVSVLGPYNLQAPPTVTLNSATNVDFISVTFSKPPFQNKTFTYDKVPDPAAYYRVFATIFYKYKKGSVVTVDDNSISTKPEKYTGVLTQDLRWTKSYSNVNTNPTGPKVGINQAPEVNPATNPVFRIPTKRSARLAMVLNNGNYTSSNLSPYAVVVSKAPLNLNDPLNLVRVSQSGCWTDNSAGVATTNTINIPGKPILLEWSKSGTELYYATDDRKVYRVSHITDIMDLSSSSYSGKLYTDVFAYANPINSAKLNPNCPYRTTLIGTFTKDITSISVSKDDKSLVVTLTGTGTGGIVWYNKNDARVSDMTNIVWESKADAVNSFSTGTTYCSLIEKSDNKIVMVGTDRGIVYTKDITATTPVWTNINADSHPQGQLPNVQVFDIEQQLMDSWDCYNSGQIYVATYGRGVWTSTNFLRSFNVGVEDYTKSESENSLHIFPNPANTKLTVEFNGIGGETATVQIMDISGRLVKTENLGEVGYGEVSRDINLEEINTGVYMVNIKSTSGTKRVAKLIVAK